MSFRNLKVCVFGPSWGPRNAEDKHWEPKHIKTPSFLSQGPGNHQMPQMSLGIGHWKCPNEFRKPQNEYFKPRRPREMSEHSFGCMPQKRHFWAMPCGKDWRIASEGSKFIFLGQCLSSGNAENELPAPRIEHNVSGQISKNTWKRLVFATFRRKQRKASKSVYEKHKNDGAITETQKNAIRRVVFGTFSKSEPAKTKKKAA